MRMRPSSVFQGWKQWASKLHPQLPLTNQESTRLLNALTGAFRQKLDEAHPSRIQDDEKQATSSRSASVFHSSAAHADKHLESILINPLLSGRDIVGDAKVELSKNPHKDPIELLENYHEQGAASVAIAELCLNHYKQSLERLPQDEQQVSIQQTQPGKRVFEWLVESNLYDSKSWVDNIAFINDLVSFLVKEGREETIWSWVKLDIGTTDGLRSPGPISKTKYTRKIQLYKYRWRGRLLRSLVSEKLGYGNTVGVGPGPNEWKAALDTIFKICDLKLSTEPSDHLYWIPMAPIATLLSRTLNWEIDQTRRDFDVAQFEKLYELIPVIHDGAPPFLIKVMRAKLKLVHPLGRQPAEALHCFQRLFSDSPSDDENLYLISLRGERLAAIGTWWRFATATIFALRMQGKLEDAEWLQAKCIKEFPQQARYLEVKMQESRQREMGRGAQLDERDADVKDQARTPFPEFA